MSLTKYIFSKDFLKQGFLAVLFLFVLVFVLLHWIDFSTHHGQEIVVPNLKAMSVDQAEDVLDELDLGYELIDTIEYNPSIPKFGVVKQDPIAGSRVKEGRKIYIKINAGAFGTVVVPNLVEQTLRQAIPTLKAIGLNEGKIIYKQYIGKDMVLELQQNGHVLAPGSKVLKASKIDLVVGDGTSELDDENAIENPDSTTTPPPNE